jgi:chaperonin cofactor prefoldin
MLLALRKEFDNLKYPTVDEVDLLRTRIDKLENQMSAMRKSLSDMEKKLKGLTVQGGGADADLLEKCVDELRKLR